MDEAIIHCTRGLGIWDWASSDDGGEPDVVLACAGDVPTLETLAAAALLREHLPELKVRVINVVDLMRLQPESEHPHGLPDREFDAMFTPDKPVIFAYHGYPWLIHRLTYRRTNHHGLHVRGYKEQGTTTTPFDMVMLNDLDRFHLVIDVIDRVPGLAPRAAGLRQHMVDERLRHRAYTREHGEDPADVRDWTWPALSRLLVVNAGSSSLKLRLLDAGDRTRRRADGRVAGRRAVPRGRARRPAGADAVAHRVVHGGDTLRAATWIDDAVRARLLELTELAPLHQPRALAAIDALALRLPETPAAACFDTAFHATMPDAAATYALPAEWPRRRFGFHGLSHAYASRRAAELLGRDDLRIVTCHLGAGASLAAVAGGRSVDTTMGFTPMDGLVMASRPGSVDPGLLLWLVQRRGVSAAELEDALEHRSGLTGLAGTGDMRELLRRSDDDARLALDVYLHRLRAGIAAMAAAMDGLDALVFTGGVGEHAPAIRAAAVDRLGFLGVAVDPDRNAEAHGDAVIGERTLVITAREDLEMARQVRELIRLDQRSSDG